MRWRDPRFFFGLASLGAVLLLVAIELGRTSPGPLSATHARVAGIDERDCEGCHGDFGEGLAPGCTHCHGDIGGQLADRIGFHGGLEAELGLDCGSCHPEHSGSELVLVSADAFARGGFASREDYDHRDFDFTLTGLHGELACVDCHPRADAALLAEGERRFTGLGQLCRTCHDDPHGGPHTAACERCHGQDLPFAARDGFDHGDACALGGGHAGLECGACHGADELHSVAALLGPRPPTQRGCPDCHASPHREAPVRAIAEALGGGEREACAACHGVEDPDLPSPPEEDVGRWHALCGFSLEPPHAELACADCHSPDTSSYSERFPGRSPGDCAACHADPHGGQFAGGPFAAASCQTCHAEQGFQPPAFGLEAHSLAAFPLEGAHREVSCERCHGVPASEPNAPRVFAGTPSACASCHADAHTGLWAAERDGTDCASCHGPTRFDEVERARFEHAPWTGFALDGAHALATCEACHAPAPEADALGRRFGRAAELFGTPTDACATCHVDAHVGTFAGRASEPAPDCRVCHTTASFADAAREGFEHGPWTGFALDGAHARARCESCHRPRERPDATGRSFGLARETFGAAIEDCASCHEDVHAGRFSRDSQPRELRGRQSCARCHGTESFRAGASETFDHKLWTGFALEGGHLGPACAGCHSLPAAEGGALGRVPGSDCRDCHLDPHACQFATGGRTDCGRCHTGSASFTALAFDHDRDSRFALDEQHASLDCAACHRPWPLAGGGQAVRYRPLGTECADCHLALPSPSGSSLDEREQPR